jgi:hypothetical protein
MTGLMHRSYVASYSITSSASASKVGGTAIPSAFAVLRLSTKNKLARLLNRKIGGLGTIQNFHGIDARMTPIQIPACRIQLRSVSRETSRS